MSSAGYRRKYIDDGSVIMGVDVCTKWSKISFLFQLFYLYVCFFIDGQINDDDEIHIAGRGLLCLALLILFYFVSIKFYITKKLSYR